MNVRGFFQDFIDYASLPVALGAGHYTMNAAKASEGNGLVQLTAGIGSFIGTVLALSSVELLTGTNKNPQEELSEAVRTNAQPLWQTVTEGIVYFAPSMATVIASCAAPRYVPHTLVAGVATAALVSAYDNFVAPQPTKEEIAQIEQTQEQATHLLEQTTDRVTKSFVERVRGTPSHDVATQPAR
ncbi:MAG: hypothetical protein EAZ52_03075 [Alphaproteobacteria bacterium]|nr:MAG: hypothetical protein EAZ52_03075 [Alphaproteobacteria bacterium]